MSFSWRLSFNIYQAWSLVLFVGYTKLGPGPGAMAALSDSSLPRLSSKKNIKDVEARVNHACAKRAKRLVLLQLSPHGILQIAILIELSNLFFNHEIRSPINKLDFQELP